MKRKTEPKKKLKNKSCSFQHILTADGNKYNSSPNATGTNRLHVDYVSAFCLIFFFHFIKQTIKFHLIKFKVINNSFVFILIVERPSAKYIRQHRVD